MGSAASGGKDTQNLSCTAQALAVLIALGVYAATGADWVDLVNALCLVAWAVRNGRHARRRRDCC